MPCGDDVGRHQSIGGVRILTKLLMVVSVLSGEPWHEHSAAMQTRFWKDVLAALWREQEEIESQLRERPGRERVDDQGEDDCQSRSVIGFAR